MAETKAKADRRADAKSVLGDHEVGPAKFVELCWTFPEIDQIDLYRITATGMNKLPQLLTKDFPPAEVEAYLLNTLGAGKYRLSPMWRPDGKYVTSRTWGFGEFKEELSFQVRPVSEPGNGAAGVVDTKQVMGALQEELRGMGLLQTWQEFVDRKEARANEREFKPIEVMGKLVTDLITAKGATPAADPQVQALKQEVQDLRRQQTEALIRKVEDLEKKLATSGQPATSTGIAEVSQQLEFLGKAATLLGFVKPEGAVAAKPQTDFWEGFAKVLEVAGPRLDKGLEMLERALTTKTAAGGNGLAAVTGGGPMALPPVVAKLLEEKKDSIALAVDCLRRADVAGGDFDTVLDILTVDLGVQLNPKAAPLTYILRFKPLIPEIDQLRPQWSLFMKWFDEKVTVAQEQAAREAAAKEVAQP